MDETVNDQWTPTTLGYALLQVLSKGTASGYDLKKFFYASIGHSWHAYDTQIYRELKRLELYGYASGIAADGLSGPPRRLYTITEAGIASLKEWLTLPTNLLKGKDEFALKIFTVSLFPDGTFLKLLSDGRAQLVEGLEDMLQARERLLASSSKPASQILDRRLAIEFAMAVTEAKITWIDRTVEEVGALEDEVVAR